MRQSKKNERVYYTHPNPEGFIFQPEKRAEDSENLDLMRDFKGEMDAGHIAFRYPDGSLHCTQKRDRSSRGSFNDPLSSFITVVVAALSDSLPEREYDVDLRDWVLRHAGLGPAVSAVGKINALPSFQAHRQQEGIADEDNLSFLLGTSSAEIGYQNGVLYCALESLLNESVNPSGVRVPWALGRLGVTIRFRVELHVVEDGVLETRFPTCTFSHYETPEGARLPLNFFPNLLQEAGWTVKRPEHIEDFDTHQHRDWLILGGQGLVHASQVWCAAYAQSGSALLLDARLWEVNALLKQYADQKCNFGIDRCLEKVRVIRDKVTVLLTDPLFSSLKKETELLQRAISAEWFYLNQRRALDENAGMPVPDEPEFPGSFFSYYPLLKKIKEEILCYSREKQDAPYDNVFLDKMHRHARIYQAAVILKMIEVVEKAPPNFRDYLAVLNEVNRLRNGIVEVNRFWNDMFGWAWSKSSDFVSAVDTALYGTQDRSAGEAAFSKVYTEQSTHAPLQFSHSLGSGIQAQLLRLKKQSSVSTCFKQKVAVGLVAGLVLGYLVSVFFSGGATLLTLPLIGDVGAVLVGCALGGSVCGVAASVEDPTKPVHKDFLLGSDVIAEAEPLPSVGEARPQRTSSVSSSLFPLPLRPETNSQEGRFGSGFREGVASFSADLEGGAEEARFRKSEPVAPGTTNRESFSGRRSSPGFWLNDAALPWGSNTPDQRPASILSRGSSSPKPFTAAMGQGSRSCAANSAHLEDAAFLLNQESRHSSREINCL